MPDRMMQANLLCLRRDIAQRSRLKRLLNHIPLIVSLHSHEMLDQVHKRCQHSPNILALKHRQAFHGCLTSVASSSRGMVLREEGFISWLYVACTSFCLFCISGFRSAYQTPFCAC
jgi:hypothetical protein